MDVAKTVISYRINSLDMSWRLLKKPYEILPDVYDITWHRQRGRRYRCYLIDAGMPTLVDTCYDEPESQTELFAGIEEIGSIPERLIITHGDADHFGGFDAVVDRYELETWVPTETVVETQHTPDYRFSDGEQIEEFIAVHVPGHEDDSYALVNEANGYAILGDTLVGADIRGLPAGYLVVHGEGSTNNVRAAEQNLTKLTTYDFDAGLVFHGSSVLEKASEKIEAYVDGPKKDK